jgi:pyruvate/2-oxoglutarate dehydrogenase complex dihydrolipoamide acyltransferase (E2) component
VKPFRSEPLTAIETYMYGLKARAHLHHCLGNGLFPVELTKLSAMRKRYSKQVQPVTLMPFFIKAVALSVRAVPGVNRILFRRFPFGRRIVRFEVVDVNVPITRNIGGQRVTFIGTIRGADKLKIAAIQDDLVHMQRSPPAESPYIEKVQKLKRAPPFVASLYHWLMTRSPRFYLNNAGTCGVTTLAGMAGGHFFPVGPATSVFGIGGIGDEVVARDGVPVVRRMLNVALALDNYVVSGPEGLLLARTFQELLESCSFVECELESASVSTGAEPAVCGQAGRQPG